jgi:hypothetical protein
MSDAVARAPSFGQRFFASVFAEFPALSGSTIFLRWSVQPDDVYASFDWPGGVCWAQIDPGLEYVIVWGAGGQAEYGDWDGDQVPPAVDHVRRLMSTPASTGFTRVRWNFPASGGC